MTVFHASGVFTSDEDGLLELAFQDDRGRYVLLSRSLEHDPQDTALGLDGPYLEIGGEDHGAYDAIAELDVTPERVRLAFDPGALGLAADSSPIEIQGDEVTAQTGEIAATVSRLLAVRQGGQSL